MATTLITSEELFGKKKNEGLISSADLFKTKPIVSETIEEPEPITTPTPTIPKLEDITQKQTALTKIEENFSQLDTSIETDYKLYQDYSKQLDDLETQIQEAPEELQFKLTNDYNRIQGLHNTLVPKIKANTAQYEQTKKEYDLVRDSFEKDVNIYNKDIEAKEATAYNRYKNLFKAYKQFGGVSGESEVSTQKSFDVSEGIPQETTLKQYTPPKENWWDKVKNIFTAKPDELKAKAQVSYNIARQTGVPINDVNQNLDKITKEMGIRGIPTTEEMISVAMILNPFTATLIGTHPISLVTGAAKYMGMGEAVNAIVSKAKGIDYKFGAGKSIKDLLPEDTNQIAKDTVDILEMIGKGWVIAKTDKNVSKLWDMFTKKTTTEYSLPEKMYLSADKIREIYRKGGIPESEYPQFEADILAKVQGNKADIVRTAFREGGVDIEIPATEMTTFADRPWFAKIKEAFGIKPISNTIINYGGKPVATTAVKGLLEGVTGIPETPVVTPEISTIKPELPKVTSTEINIGKLDETLKTTLESPVTDEQILERQGELVTKAPTTIEEAREILKQDPIKPAQPKEILAKQMVEKKVSISDIEAVKGEKIDVNKPKDILIALRDIKKVEVVTEATSKTAIPKGLEGLAEEAKKAKDVDDFVKANVNDYGINKEVPLIKNIMNGQKIKEGSYRIGKVSDIVNDTGLLKALNSEVKNIEVVLINDERIDFANKARFIGQNEDKVFPIDIPPTNKGVQITTTDPLKPVIAININGFNQKNFSQDLYKTLTHELGHAERNIKNRPIDDVSEKTADKFMDFYANNRKQQLTDFYTQATGKAGATTEKTKEVEYVYHGTDPSNLESIAKDGLKTPAERGVFDREDYTQFSKTEKYSKDFMEIQGKIPLMLRVKNDGSNPNLYTPENYPLSVLSSKRVPPESIEMKMPDGSWKPITEVVKETTPATEKPAGVETPAEAELTKYIKKYGYKDKDYKIVDYLIAKIKTITGGEKPELVKKYTEMVKSGVNFAPIMTEDGYILDGGHRLQAYKAAGKETIPALVPIGQGSGKVVNFSEFYKVTTEPEGTGGIGKSGLPEAGKGKVSGVAQRINATAIEMDLTKGFGHLAEFTPGVIKEQAKIFSDLINNDIDQVRSMVRGETAIPANTRGSVLVTAMNNYAVKTANGEILNELASSPLTSELSAAGSELSLSRGNEGEINAVKVIQDINKIAEGKATKGEQGKSYNDVKNEAITETKTKVTEQVNKANNKYSWTEFIRSIQCK